MAAFQSQMSPDCSLLDHSSEQWGATLRHSNRLHVGLKKKDGFLFSPIDSNSAEKFEKTG